MKKFQNFHKAKVKVKRIKEYKKQKMISILTRLLKINPLIKWLKINRDYRAIQFQFKKL